MDNSNRGEKGRQGGKNVSRKLERKHIASREVITGEGEIWVRNQGLKSNRREIQLGSRFSGSKNEIEAKLKPRQLCAGQNYPFWGSSDQVRKDDWER